MLVPYASVLWCQCFRLWSWKLWRFSVKVGNKVHFYRLPRPRNIIDLTNKSHWKLKIQLTFKTKYERIIHARSWSAGAPIHWIALPFLLCACNSSGTTQRIFIKFHIAAYVTRYELDGQGIESRWGRDFPHPSRRALGHVQLPTQWVLGLLPGSKAAGAWR